MNTHYDISIVGGGLAGLTSAINLARKGFSVILFEKETYPFHKVCGEYISLESWDYLEELGLPLGNMQLPIINSLQVTSPSGKSLETKLSLGGFGISRFHLDNTLRDLAVSTGVTVLDTCKVYDLEFINDNFQIHSAKGNFSSLVCCGSFGKRSNIDIKWKRSFITNPVSRLNNYIAVKYHLESTQKTGQIALHNFQDGYCGISEIENHRYCLCYLTNAQNLKKSGSIEKMEETILSSNPYLKEIFKTSRKILKPLSISQISFEHKAQVENHVLMIGDSAGLITPLCGNGMSMAIHGGKIASEYIHDFLGGRITRVQMENNYASAWKKNFQGRIQTGRMIQRFFGSASVTNIFISVMKLTPQFTKYLISLTHGKRF